MNYSEIMQKALKKNISKEVWQEIEHHTEHFIEDVSKHHPEKVKEFLRKLKDSVCYPPITEEEAKTYVSKMHNKDGSMGGHWTVEQVRELSKTHPALKNFNFADFYIALNMMYSDYYQPNRNMEEYAQLAIDFLGDKDAPKNKIRRYMEAMED